MGIECPGWWLLKMGEVVLKADQEHFNCRMSLCFHLLKAEPGIVWSGSLLPVCPTVLPKAQLTGRETGWNTQWKKMKKNESSLHGNVPEACHSRIIRPWWEEWKAVSLSESPGFGFLLFLFCFVFSKIWFRGKMWPLKTNTNYASISFKYINIKTKRKDPRVEKMHAIS